MCVCRKDFLMKQTILIQDVFHLSGLICSECGYANRDKQSNLHRKRLYCETNISHYFFRRQNSRQKLQSKLQFQAGFKDAISSEKIVLMKANFVIQIPFHLMIKEIVKLFLSGLIFSEGDPNVQTQIIREIIIKRLYFEIDISRNPLLFLVNR